MSSFSRLVFNSIFLLLVGSAEPSALAQTNSQPQTLTFVFKDTEPRITYPWKRDVVTTVFTMKNGLSTAEGWNRRRNANAFYVALPFNDLTFPDKARRWVPANWARPGKPNLPAHSACKGRWVEIQNEKGTICYAQWDDVGPLRSDDAEYVFGRQPPKELNGDRAGLGVSSAVARHLGILQGHHMTSWRFVQARDVPPGDWLHCYESDGLILIPDDGD